MEKSYFITAHTENEKNPWYDTESTVILKERHYILSLLILANLIILIWTQLKLGG